MEKYCRTEQAKDDDRPTLIKCCITKATNTHSGCVILIAFSLQQWLHEGASVLLYNYIACTVVLNFIFFIYT